MNAHRLTLCLVLTVAVVAGACSGAPGAEPEGESDGLGWVNRPPSKVVVGGDRPGSLESTTTTQAPETTSTTEAPPSTAAPTTVAPTTTAPPTTAAPTTTAPPTTAAPTTTAPPTTAAPTTTTPPTTAPPTTVAPTTTAKPTTTAAPTTSAPPTTAPPSGSSSAGTTVGSANYPVPAGAVVVSPTGSDSASGTQAAPLKTLTRAIAVASSGSTIVLRSGVYHETVVVPTNKRLTIQSWPGESVWMDGSVPVTGWVADGSRWRKDGWTVEFDASPTYTWGAADNTDAGWGFVNPSHPMAAHPDQLFVDGVQLKQVQSLSQVTGNTFFHDKAADRLYMGVNPASKQVRASALTRAISLRSDNSAIKGIGVRRYAPSVPHMGAITAERAGNVIEHVVVSDVATTGIHLMGVDSVVRNVHVQRAGMLGISATYTDRLLVENLLSEHNNNERFNMSPVSGGIKILRSRGVTVRSSVLRSNHGPGIWIDESVYNVSIVNNTMVDNAGHGTSLELAARANFVGNKVIRNGRDGVKVNNTSDVQIWNNTFTGNGRSINLVQDNRRASNRSTPGHDPRQPHPDPTMTWLLGPVRVANNIIANPSSGNCLLCVEDYSKERSAEQIGVIATGNVYNRKNSSTPTWLVVWSKGPGNPAAFTTLSAFRSATGQESTGHLVDGAPVVDANGTPTAAMPSSAGATALPQTIASLAGRSTGSQHLGAF